MNYGQSVTITIPRRQEVSPFKVGDKVKLSKKSFMRRMKKIKTKEMVWRMKGKNFEPLLIIYYCTSVYPGQYNATLKPYNF